MSLLLTENLKKEERETRVETPFVEFGKFSEPHPIFAYLFFFLKLYFKFWDTYTEPVRLLHRYTHAVVVCCTHQPVIHIRHFS